MKQLRIYRLAFEQLWREIVFEESKLKHFPKNDTIKARLELLKQELDELTNLMVEEEHKEC